MKNSIYAVLASVVLVSCSVPKNPLVGKWQNESGGIQLEYTANGKVQIIDSGPNVPDVLRVANGTYKIEGNTIKCQFEGVFALGGLHADKFSVSGNELVITNADGKTTRYKRL